MLRNSSVETAFSCIPGKNKHRHNAEGEVWKRHDRTQEEEGKCRKIEDLFLQSPLLDDQRIQEQLLHGLLDNLFFNGVFRDEAINLNVLLLTDTVSWKQKHMER
jgi:hypothetical protein